MDRDAIGLAVHDISMMVQLLLNTVETLHGNEATPRALEVPHNEGKCFPSSHSISTSGSMLCGTGCHPPSHHAVATALHPSPTTAPLK